MEWKFSTDTPIYTQLVEKLRSAIASGAIPPGQRMPAVRELAVEAAVNPNTVQRAYLELERTGLVYVQRASGRYATEDPALIASAREQLARERTVRYLQDMDALGYGKEELFQLIQNLKEEV